MAVIDKIARSGDGMTGPLNSSSSVVPGAATLPYAPAIAVNAGAGNHFRVTLAGNAFIQSPSGGTDGQKITLELIQDASGNRTVSWDGSYTFGTDIPRPVLSAAPGLRDMLAFAFNSGTGRWYCLAYAQGAGAAGPGTAITLYGAAGTFGTIASQAVTSTGHSLSCVTVPGWGFGPGLAAFYSRATPDGQIILGTLPQTENELRPTMNRAEVEVFNPAVPVSQSIVIPTSTGALTAVNPANGLGGTDVGSGDIALVNAGGQNRILLTCQGYYFGWNIPVTGLYPALAYLTETAGAWSYSQPLSLTGDQWEATNPSLFQSVIAPNGQASGNGASYWSPRFPGQMAVLPASGNVVIGHYFGFGGTGSNSGGISVISPSGNLLAAYQIPNITPLSGTMSFAAVRDVEADPLGVLGNEQFAVIYDAFGTGIHATIQVFSYNQGAQTVTPVSVPCTPADTGTVPQFCLFGPDGTLYVTTGQASNGLLAGNCQAYLRKSGGWNLTSQAPVFPGWQSSSWPTPVAADYSLGFARQLGGLAGPMQADSAVTGAILVPGASSRLGAVLPSPAGISSLGPNLMPAFASNFTPPNLLTANDATFATGLGSWAPFLGIETLVTSPPAAPPAGTNAMQMLQAFGFAIFNTAAYAVLPSTQYQWQPYFLAGSVSRQCQAYVQWQTSGGTPILTTPAASVTDPVGAWAPATVVATSPPNAGRAVLFVQVNNSAPGEPHYLAANSLVSLSAAAAGWTPFVDFIALTSAQAFAGSFSLAVTAAYPSEVLFASGPPVPVNALTEYFAAAVFRAQAVPQQCQVQMTWLAGSGSVISVSPCSMTVTDSAAGWAMATCGGLAPQGVSQATANVLISSSTAGETHYVDQVTLQAQPFTAIPYADYQLGAVRSMTGTSAGCGRPSIAGRKLYIPISVPLTPAQSAQYGAGTYTPQANPQYLACADLVQLLGE